MPQKTAVDCISSKLRALIQFDSVEERKNFTSIIQQAKVMEKEQIIDAYCDGFKKGSEGNRILSEQYYNETYNK